jgi:hypothetical protein
VSSLTKHSTYCSSLHHGTDENTTRVFRASISIHSCLIARFDPVVPELYLFGQLLNQNCVKGTKSHFVHIQILFPQSSIHVQMCSCKMSKTKAAFDDKAAIKSRHTKELFLSQLNTIFCDTFRLLHQTFSAEKAQAAICLKLDPYSETCSNFQYCKFTVTSCQGLPKLSPHVL